MKRGSSDLLWILLGGFLLLGTVSVFSPTSQLGKGFVSVRSSLESMFGSGTGYCPFINPYAMSLLSAGELTISGEHSLCGPIKLVLKECSGGGCSDSQRADYLYENLFNDQGNCVEPISLSLVSEKGRENFDINITTAEEGYVVVPYDLFFSVMSNVQRGVYEGTAEATEYFGNKGAKVAASLLAEKRPIWQCFGIFGLLPFLILFYMLNDILMFAPFTSRTRKLIAIFGSFLTIISGGFANLVFSISNFVGLSTGPAFLLIVFGLALLSIVISQVAVSVSAGKQAYKSAEEAFKAAAALKGINAALDNDNRQNDR